MRQHVNPLSRYFQLPLKLPAPNELFENATRPLHLDIGSARGKFLLGMASQYSNWNYLGVEIRRPLVNASDRERKKLELNNLRFLFCNANVSLQDWLNNLPYGMLQSVSIQFPDPWFKRRHTKRRLLQPTLLTSIASALQPGAQLFIQSDLLNVIEPMVKLVNLSECFERHLGVEGQMWLDQNPMPIPSERESYVVEKCMPVFRALYKRNYESTPEIDILEGLFKNG